ncbi:BamA/TamA family outer membrane protein [Selenomonadales bacterium OttesenSCG-928-I06]|nr:BamA/TamA family outer membrane protein [Selenomonadales bacterium OttesenSCG-928-I06]
MKLRAGFNIVFISFLIVTFMSFTALSSFAEQVDGNQPEGQPAYVGKPITSIEVTGNVNISKDIVLGVIQSKPGELLELDNINEDIKAIYDLGYFFEVPVNFVMTPEGVQVIYTVMENPVLTEVVIKGVTCFPEETIRNYITNKPGEVINTRTLNNNILDISNHYQKEGYILAKVSDVSMLSGGILSITINEGILEDIIVTGNVKTKDKVILREMRVEKGKPFNADKARLSLQKVYNLGLFEDTNMKLNPGIEPNAVVMQIDVVEQKTGLFSIGAGYSDSDGLVGIIELGDQNFRGQGDKIVLHWEIGGADNKNHEISYFKPWLDSKQTSLGISIYDMTNEYYDYYDNGDERSVYDRRRKGFDITLGRPHGDKIFNYITFRQRKYSFEEYISGDVNPQDDPKYMEDNFGTSNSVTLSRVIDTRDNYINPSNGTRLMVSAEFAGLGGDFSYNKYTIENRKYFRVRDKHVLAFRATVGYATGDLPDFARFAVGGMDTVRGYEDNQFRGDHMFAATLEYRIPVQQKIELVIFGDIGNAWRGSYDFGDLYGAVGIGIRFNSPLGPIRLDYAQGEQGGKTHFSFGGQF